MINEIIQHIWTACEGKHDSIIRCLYDIIITISSNMNKESLAILYRKLKELDVKAMVCSELQRLLMPTLEAAFVPFVEQFERRMLKLEHKQVGEG